MSIAISGLTKRFGQMDVLRGIDLGVETLAGGGAWALGFVQEYLAADHSRDATARCKHKDPGGGWLPLPRVDHAGRQSASRKQKCRLT